MKDWGRLLRANLSPSEETGQALFRNSLLNGKDQFSLQSLQLSHATFLKSALNSNKKKGAGEVLHWNRPW